MQAFASPVGWRVWGAGIVALGLVGLAFGDFDPGQRVPDWFPGRIFLAVAANAFMVIAGAAVQWCAATARATAALVLYYGLVVIILMCGRVIITHPTEFLAYNSTAAQVAITTAGLIVYATHAKIDAVRSARLTRLAQRAFGVCALLFGAAHFVYFNLTAPLVPAWLPPSQAFWAYLTGAAHIAAGAAILTGVQARLAAILLTIMFAAFTPLVHLPLALADPHTHFIWAENAVNLALTGAAWVIADSFARANRASAVSLTEIAERLERDPRGDLHRAGSGR